VRDIINADCFDRSDAVEVKMKMEDEFGDGSGGWGWWIWRVWNASTTPYFKID
jgi:hypothetical protein